VQTVEAEICVIGGGPAGATAARRLALLGHDVCLLEGARFPRPHVGESLAPGVLLLLEFLDVRRRVEAAGFLRPKRALVRWGGALRRLDFTPGEPGLQVDRGRFDCLLLDAAREAGVKVLQPAHAARPQFVGGERWIVPFDYEGETRQVAAVYVVDASGRRAALGGRRSRHSPPTLALYAYWRAPLLEGEETRVEAGVDEWFWGAPLPDGTFNATVFVDPQRGRVAGRGSWLETFYRSLLAGSSLLRGCLEGERVSRVMACDATTYIAEHPVTLRSIKIGEASLTVDPLSSQGVQTAMTSAVHGSIVVHTLLTHPEHAHAALGFYRERQTESASYHRRAAARYYSEQHSVSPQKFWRERATASEEAMRVQPAAARDARALNFAVEGCRFRPSQEVSLDETPCVVGDIIRHVTAVAHPSLARPVAFVKNVEVAPLLHVVNSGGTVAEILSRWSASLPAGDGLEMFRWMCAAGLLVPVRD
jgi:flavin-dependent dehydrogenase